MRRPDWQPIKSAAARLGLHPGHLRRLCQQGRLPAGMASRRPLPSGQMGWAVRSDFTPPVRRRRVAIVAGRSRIVINIHTPEHVTIDVLGSGSKGR